MGVCRLCLQIIDGTGILNPETTLQTFQKFHPHMSRTLINTPIICETCFENVKTGAKLLKTKTESDLKILRELKRLKVAKIDLRGFQKNMSTQCNISICRICLLPISRPRIFLCESNANVLPHDYVTKMLKFCNITVNLEVSERPVMCLSCWEDLQITFTFKKEYLEVERKIRVYCQELRLRSKKLSMETLQKVQNYFSDEYCEIIPLDIKQEVKLYRSPIKKEYKKNVVNNRTKDVSDHKAPKTTKFYKEDNQILMEIYLEVTNNERDFHAGYWKGIADKWAERKPSKPIPVQKLGIQLQQIFRKNLLTRAEMNRLRAAIDAKHKLQTQKNQETQHYSDSDDSFVEEAAHSSFTPHIKPEPLSESEIEFNSLQPKLELESDCESLPELERMDLPPLNFKIEKIYSLQVKREAYDNYMRQEEDGSKTDTWTEGLNKSRSESLRDRKGVFKCNQCDFETSFKTSAERHISMHRKGKKKFYQCTNCPYRISSKWLLNKHMKCHKEEDEIPVLQPSAYFLFDN